VRTVLIHPDIRDVQARHEERAAQLRSQIHSADPRPARRPVRRWIGHQLMRVGARLASEPTLKPIRSS
jgi:hypothetical protein